MPVLLVGVVALRGGRLDFGSVCGILCGSMANPMALTYANTVSDDQEASEAYATVYPLSMFLRVISAQLITLLFLG